MRHIDHRGLSRDSPPADQRRLALSRLHCHFTVFVGFTPLFNLPGALVAQVNCARAGSARSRRLWRYLHSAHCLSVFRVAHDCSVVSSSRQYPLCLSEYLRSPAFSCPAASACWQSQVPSRIAAPPPSPGYMRHPKPVVRQTRSLAAILAGHTQDRATGGTRYVLHGDRRKPDLGAVAAPTSAAPPTPARHR